MDVNYYGNENICEAIITITFSCNQTRMKHDMNKFNLAQFEHRIQNLINLLVNKKNAQYVFPASVILNITNQSRHHFSVIVLMMYFFL